MPRLSSDGSNPSRKKLTGSGRAERVNTTSGVNRSGTIVCLTREDWMNALRLLAIGIGHEGELVVGGVGVVGFVRAGGCWSRAVGADEIDGVSVGGGGGPTTGDGWIPARGVGS